MCINTYVAKTTPLQQAKIKQYVWKFDTNYLNKTLKQVGVNIRYQNQSTSFVLICCIFHAGNVNLH